jgi:hypothetical protein
LSVDAVLAVPTDAPSTRHAVELVDDGTAAWFLADTIAGATRTYTLHLQSGPAAQPFPGFAVVAHCDSDRVLPTGSITASGVDGGVGAACRPGTLSGAPIANETELVVHASWQACSSQTSLTRGLLSRRPEPSAASNFHLDDVGCRPTFFNASQGHRAGAALTDHAFHDVSFSISGGTPTAVVDGLEVATDLVVTDARSGVPVASPPVGVSLFVGSDPNGDDPRNAELVDELFALTTARSAPWLQVFHAGLRGFVATTTAKVEATQLESRALASGTDRPVMIPGSVGASTLKLSLPQLAAGQHVRFHVDVTITPTGMGSASFAAGVGNRSTTDVFAPQGTFVTIGCSGGLGAIRLDNSGATTASSSATCSGSIGVEVVVDSDGRWWASTSMAGSRWTGSSAGVVSSSIAIDAAAFLGVSGGTMMIERVFTVIEPL